jgi:uncharacterized repeat protein (TIGR03803 family)
MTSKTFPLSKLSGALAVALVMSMPSARAGVAPVLTSLYSFQGTPDGANPEADLIIDSNGNIYGTTIGGGAYGWGAVYQLTPNGGSWTETVLYSFTGGADGANPTSILSISSTGLIYGTAFGGGSVGYGTIFQLTPPILPGGTWTETVVHNFGVSGLDGINPQTKLLISATGDLYGTTYAGGLTGLGVVFQFSIATGQERILYAFNGGTDGAHPQSGLIDDQGRKFYGTTYQGGAPGYGTVFQLTLGTGGVWNEKVLYGFTGGADGGIPNPGMFLDRSGSGVLYGSTFWGGNINNCLESGYPSGCGVVFSLTPPTTAGQPWTEAVLYAFTGTVPDGAHPYPNLIFGVGGTIYGTTISGGTREDNCFVGSYRGCGTIYRLSPPVGTQDGAWTSQILHVFRNSDGGGPYGMIRGPVGSGVFYGATTLGGSSPSFGTVFQFKP